MHDYNVVWAREAIYDVADIADYIELRFGRERADQFNDEIEAEGEALTLIPPFVFCSGNHQQPLVKCRRAFIHAGFEIFP